MSFPFTNFSTLVQFAAMVSSCLRPRRSLAIAVRQRDGRLPSRLASVEGVEIEGIALVRACK